MVAETEYHEAMIKLLELIWGEGFMAPGGPGKVDDLVRGLALGGQDVLDIGSGLGGPGCHLAASHGAVVTGIDIEPQLVDIANRRAMREGLEQRARFVLVEPGPLPFADATFDVVISSGALTQIPDKAGLLAEALRVLRPGGAMRNFEWTKSVEELSEDLLYFFKMEGLTYALETPATYARLLGQVGFVDITTADDTGWYRRGVREEYERMKGDLYPRMQSLLGVADADHFVEDWRSMVVVFENGELTQTVCRSRKPGQAV
jgi:SAM-dependent methyltransferase